MRNQSSNVAEYSNLRELKAESLLALSDMQDAVVKMKGIFYRNYSSDLMSHPTDSEKIELSRDSIFHLLREGLFFDEDDIKDKDKFEEKKEKRELFFLPFDSEYFNLSLKLEKEINDICEKDLLNLPRSPYFPNLTCLAGVIRGNEPLIIDILKTIINAPKIELIKNNHSEFIKKTFIIHIPKLSTEQYAQKKLQISKIFEIFKEYFLPFDIEYDFKIKDRQQKFILHENLILDYNINL